MNVLLPNLEWDGDGNAEEMEMQMALSLNAGRLISEGIPGRTSSELFTPQDSRIHKIEEVYMCVIFFFT